MPITDRGARRRVGRRWRTELAAAAVAEVLAVEHAALGALHARRASRRRCGTSSTQRHRPFVLLPHTYQTRDFAPMLAARLRSSRSSPTSSASTGTGADATFTRPMFQGKLAAEVKPAGRAPRFVTMQIGAFRADAAQKGGSARRSRTIDDHDRRSRDSPEAGGAVPGSQAGGRSRRPSASSRSAAASSRRRTSPLAEKLAKAMGAELAASRPICDNGWLPMERQIGSSGQTVAPKLYVALGISGAIQHLVGMKGSRTIVAINKDADAPIFEVADYGIVGDLFEIVPALIAELEKSSRESRRLRDLDRSVIASRRLVVRMTMTRETLEVDVLIVGGGPGGPVGRAASRAAAEAAGRRAAVDRRPREGARGRRAPAVGRGARSVDAARADSRLRGEGRAARRRRSHDDNVYFLTERRRSRCRSFRRRSRTTATTSSR